MMTIIDSGFLDGVARDLYYQKNICPHKMRCNSRKCYNAEKCCHGLCVDSRCNVHYSIDKHPYSTSYAELYNENERKQRYVPFYNDDIIRTTSYQPFNPYESYYSYKDAQYYK